mmetsp:Transcript_30805/g.63297  ORF Transcript_30805/g.63297 Transcript_30805/m.63297 type:complete len:791 (+) Transcript_30805:370-2742(+)
MASEETRHVLDSIDDDYTPLGCLGTGGFGSVFLAKKKSGRKVALKFMLMDTNDEDEFDLFTREIEAVVELNSVGEKESKAGNRDLSIVFFEDWKIGHHFVCIVMNYADGGTMAQDIQRKASRSPVEPYTERRIAWYALQICNALAYAHERGVAHHDVKSANILIDASAGGKLLLADFGASVKLGDESVGFTRSYASPELLASHELEDYSNLQPNKIDAFGVGCILYELIICNVLEGAASSEQTLAEFIAKGNGLEATMSLGHIKLPWLPNSGEKCGVGYSQSLKSLISNFLRPEPKDRWLPGQITSPLCHDPLSPLLLPSVSASYVAIPGAPVTIDNIQLGMFVQRGPDWDDGDEDGGVGSIGVIVKLDADALYTEATFPTKSGSKTLELCCRIGASKKFELKIGPLQLPDFCSGSNAMRSSGIVPLSDEDISRVYIGQKINHNCMIVGIDKGKGIVFAAPLEKIETPSLPRPTIWETSRSSFVTQRAYTKPPPNWQPELGLYADVTDAEERINVLNTFYATDGGVSKEDFTIESIQRIQDTRLWECYVRKKNKVSMEYWGMPNETMVFLRCTLSNRNLNYFQSDGMHYSTRSSLIHDKFNGQAAALNLFMFFGCVIVGRVHDCAKTADASKKYHSILTEHNLFQCQGSNLAYPQYIISYKRRISSPSPVQRRIIHAVRPISRTTSDIVTSVTSKIPDPLHHHEALEAVHKKLFGSNTSNDAHGKSPTKMCVICMENPVRYLLIPCGHPSICEKCVHPQVLRNLKKLCPECRAPFRETVIIYGRVVNDDA